MTNESSLSELESLLEIYPGIQYIDAILSDLHGCIRGKRYPIKDAHKIYSSGVQCPETVFLLDFMGDTADPCGRGYSDGDPDGTLRPIRGSTVYVPWASEGRAQVLMQLFTEDGDPGVVDARNIAARVVERFKNMDYKVNLAFELEFYLLDKELTTGGRPQFPRIRRESHRPADTEVYSMQDLDQHSDFLNDVYGACSVQSIPASVVSSEYSPSQFEINLQHVDDPLLAADQCVLLKHVVREVAACHEMRATFMAKPFLDYSGSGTHVHLSLEDQSGENVFCGETKYGSAILKHAIGGLLDSAADMFTFFAPTRNSFRRFVPDMFVPVNKTWGVNNRSVAIRIPAGDASARRLEHRISGADTCPYLVLSAILAGVQYGIENSIDPGEPAPQENVSADVDASIPLNWEQSLAVFEKSLFAQSYLGRDYVDLYCAVKRDELKQYYEYIPDRDFQLFL